MTEKGWDRRGNVCLGEAFTDSLKYLLTCYIITTFV